MLQVGNTYLYQANFPRSQRDKLPRLYYTVFNSDGSTYLSRNQGGIVEFGNGAYGVMIGFNSAGSWSIQWDIDNSPYVASEEINIYDDNVIYTTYGL